MPVILLSVIPALKTVSATQPFVTLTLIIIYINMCTYIQGAPGGMCQTPGDVPYVKVHRYNPKHLYPKLNGYRDNGERSLKV